MSIQTWQMVLHVVFIVSPEINKLKRRQNGCLFTGDIFKCIFFNEKVWISISISLTFILKDPIDNIPALVQIMAWRLPGNNPLSEPMMVSLLMHICVTLPQCVNHLPLVWVLYFRIQFNNESWPVHFVWWNGNGVDFCHSLFWDI